MQLPISGVKSDLFKVQFLENNTAYIVRLVSVNTPKEYQDISAELLPASMADTYYYLSNDIRSKSKIEIMPDTNMWSRSKIFGNYLNKREATLVAFRIFVIIKIYLINSMR